MTDALDLADALAKDAEELSKRAQELAEEMDREDAANQEMRDKALTMRAEFGEALNRTLLKLERLHAEAHGDRTPLRLCTAPVCRDLVRTLGEEYWIDFSPRVSASA